MKKYAQWFGGSTGLLLILALASATLDPVECEAGAAKQPKVGPRIARPKMLIVVTDANKDGLWNLPHAVDSAVSIGVSFQEIGYDVQFLASTESAKKVKDAMMKAIRSAKPVVNEANNGQELTDAMRSWMREVAQNRSPLAFLVLIGHGEQRGIEIEKGGRKEDIAFLLGRDDKRGEGGVSIREVCQEAGSYPIPLVIVYDACREDFKAEAKEQTGPSDKKGPNLPEAGEDKNKWSGKGDEPASGSLLFSPEQVKNRNDVLRFYRTPGEAKLPTVIYSTRSKKQADDKDDLVSSLAKGARTNDEVKRALMGVAPELAKADYLMLHHWLLYGVVQVANKSILKQSYDVTWGIVPPNAAIAKFKQDKLLLPDLAFSPTYLLNQWDPRWGEFESENDDASGHKVTHPAKGTTSPKTAYRSGPLGAGAGYDLTSSHILVLDVIARYAGRGPAPKSFACEIHGMHTEPGIANPTYLCQDKQIYNLPYDRVMTVRVPMSPSFDAKRNPLSLNCFAFAAARPAPAMWPKEANITLLDMTLEAKPAAATMPSWALKEADLLTQWRPFNSVPGRQPLLQAKPDAKLGWRLHPKTGETGSVFSQCGSDLLTPVYLAKDSELIVDVYNASTKAATFTIEVMSISEKDGQIEGRTLLPAAARSNELPAGKSQKIKLPVVHDGWAHYLAIGSNSEIVLKSLKVAPKAIR